MVSYTFSIIIPAYHNLDLFKKAFHSVLKQKEVELELIIVDDTVGNEIRNFISQVCDNRIRYYQNTPPLGAVSNWNYGLRLAVNDIIIVLHHDEEFISDYHLKGIGTLMQKNTEVVISDIKVETNNIVKLHVFSSYRRLKSLFYRFPILLFLVNTIGPCGCVAFRRYTLQYFDIQLKWLVDIEWYYRIIKKRKCLMLSIDYYVLSHHGHGQQITSSLDIEYQYQMDIKVLLSKYRFNIGMLLILFLDMLLQNKLVKKIIRRG